MANRSRRRGHKPSATLRDLEQEKRGNKLDARQMFDAASGRRAAVEGAQERQGLPVEFHNTIENGVWR